MSLPSSVPPAGPPREVSPEDSPGPRPTPPLGIAYAAIRYHPAPGGAETHVRALAQGMAARGHKVTVFTSDLHTEVPWARLTHPKVPRIDSGSHNNRRALFKGKEWDGPVRVRRFHAFSLPGELHYPVMPGMVAALLKAEVEVVHVHSYGYFQTLVGALKRRLQGRGRERGGPVLVFTPHYHPPWSMWGGAERRALREQLFDPLPGHWSVGTADALVGVSGHELELLQEGVGFEGQRTQIIPNGIHLGQWQPPPSGRSFLARYGQRLWRAGSKAGPLLLYGGRLASNKGLAYLLQAMPPLLAEHPNLRLALVGADTGEGARLRRLTGELGLADEVLFTGHLDEALYQSAFGAADLFVLPSEYEAFGIVLLEAGVAGLPCVATRVGGVPEVVVEGQTGLLVEYGDVEGLARALGELLADPERRADMGRAASRRVRANFGWQSVVERVEGLYLRLLKPL